MRRNSTLRLTAPLTILLLGSSPSDAQQFRATLPVARLVTSYRTARFLRLSSDGQWLYNGLISKDRGCCRDVASVGAEIARTDGYDIWITNTQSLHSENVTGGVGANWGPVWSPTAITLPSFTRSGNANLWVYDTRSASCGGCQTPSAVLWITSRSLDFRCEGND
jgi:hypothetical protein